MADSKKLVTIGADKFEIRKLPAKDACWLFYQSSKLAAGAEKPVSEAEFLAIQKKCLKAVFHITTPDGAVAPIFEPVQAEDSGDFFFLKDDPVGILGLTLAALSFNTKPFLAEGVLDKIIAQVD